MAAAEDFNPLRIRPYVTLDEDDRPTTELRMAGPLPPLAPELPPPPGAMPPQVPAPDARHRAPRRPMKAVAFGVTAVAVLSTAAFATGVFSGGEHTDEALADATHTGLPDAGLPDGPSSGTPSTPSTSALSPSSPSPSASLSTAPATHAAPVVKAEPVHRDEAEQPHVAGAGSLRFGDSGSQVVALQQRLSSLYLYHGSADGHYDQGVESSVRIYQMYRHINGDPPGVYGPNTRQALEAEKAPQQHSPSHQQPAHGGQGSGTGKQTGHGAGGIGQFHGTSASMRGLGGMGHSHNH
jgi:peptidoglycan hydrolase-like protein with peptidoglycan-binding domain